MDGKMVDVYNGQRYFYFAIRKGNLPILSMEGDAKMEKVDFEKKRYAQTNIDDRIFKYEE